MPWSDGISVQWEETPESLLGFSPQDTAGRQLSASQEESSHQNPTLLAPWCWTFQPPKLWDHKFPLRKSPPDLAFCCDRLSSRRQLWSKGHYLVGSMFKETWTLQSRSAHRLTILTVPVCLAVIHVDVLLYTNIGTLKFTPFLALSLSWCEKFFLWAEISHPRTSIHQNNTAHSEASFFFFPPFIYFDVLFEFSEGPSLSRPLA